MPTLTSGELDLLAADGHKAKFYLSVSQPRSLLAGFVNGSLARGATSVPYDNGLGSLTDIKAGQVLKVQTQWGPETIRLRAISGSAASGTITPAYNSIVWGDNDIFEVLEDYPLTPRPPRFTSSTFYKDGDDVYVDEGAKPPPVIIAGPHRAKFLESGQAVFDIDLTGSYAIARGASMVAANYSVNVTPSTGVTVNVTNGVGTITFTNAGQYWVEFGGEDGNGKTQLTRRRYWVHDPIVGAADYPYTDFEVQTLNGDWQRGGWSLGIKVNGVADTDTFPEEALVCLWYTVSYGGTEQYIGQPDGTLFCGYIRKGSVVANWDDGTVTFEAQTIESVLRNLNMRSIPLQATQSPAKWYEYAHWLTNGRGLHHYWRYHSTLFEICDVFGLTDNLYGRAGMIFQKGDMYSQALAVVRDYGVQAHIVSNAAGQLRVVQDIQLLDDTARAAKTVVADITKPYRHDNITVMERPSKTTAMVYVQGIAFDGNKATAICSKSPGDIPEAAGVTFKEVLNQTLNTQAQANKLAGRIDAQENNPNPEVRILFNGIWAGVLDIAAQEWYKLSLAAGDTSRGIVWTDKKIACRQINHRIDAVNGYIASETVFEPEAEGPEGVTDTCIGLPDKPDPPAPQWSSGGSGSAGLPALLAFSSANYRDENATDWDTLQSAAYNYPGCVDPWWQIKRGSVNPRDVIWWAVTDGAIYRVVGVDGIPQNRTPTNDPPNTFSDTPAPQAGQLEFIQIWGDRWIKNRFFALARWQNGSGYYRGWLLVSDDDGFSWSYVDLYDGVSLPDQIRPLWGANNGTSVLVTIWEDDTSDTLRLLEFDAATVSYQAETSLGAATASEVDNRDYFAFPELVIDDDDLWFVAGRMTAPAGLAGVQHVIKSANAGTSFSSVESGWGSDHCIGLILDKASGSTRAYWAARDEPISAPPSSPPATSTWSAGGSDPSTIGNTNDGSLLYGFSDSNPFTIKDYDPVAEANQDIHLSGDTTGSLLDSSYLVSFKGDLYMGTYETDRVRVYRYSGTPRTWNEVFDSGVVSGLSAEGDAILWATPTHLILSAGNNGSSPYVRASTDGDSWSSFSLSDSSGDDPDFETDGFGNGQPFYFLGDKQYTGLTDIYILTASGKQLIKWTGTSALLIDDAVATKYRYMPAPWHHWRVDTTAGSYRGNFSTWAYRTTQIATNGFESGWTSNPTGPGGETVIPVATIGGNYPAGISLDGNDHYLHWFYDGQWSIGELAFTHSNSTSLDEPAVQVNVLDDGTVVVNYHVGFGSTNFAIRDDPV